MGKERNLQKNIKEKSRWKKKNIQDKKLRGYKLAASMFKGHNGPQTIRHNLSFIPWELRERLTGYELGVVMNAVYDAYMAGKTVKEEE